jgi:ribosomal protein S13
MGKKGADGVPGDGSTEVDMEALKLGCRKMEDLQQEQSKELKNKVVSSQQLMKMELREQMNEFFARLMKVQTSTPPSQPMLVESLTSNMAHVVD